MVTVDALLAWLRRVTGYTPTVWSLLRIGVVLVLALVLAGVVLPDHPGQTRTAPYNSRLATPTTRNVALPLNDPRGFKPSNHPNRFNVAWVGGSELLGVDPKRPAFIPRLVNDKIGAVDGHRVDTDIYFLNAIRLADELSAESAAVAAKPDMLVISLNPVWVLNDLAVQQWGYLDGVLARGSLWPPSSWSVGASLVSPGDVGWRALSSISRPVQQRYDWGVKTSNKTGSFTFLDSKTDKAPPPLTPLGAFAAKRPVDFWFSHFSSSSTSRNLSDVQLRIMERELASKSAMNPTVLNRMFDMAHRAGHPDVLLRAADRPPGLRSARRCEVRRRPAHDAHRRHQGLDQHEGELRPAGSAGSDPHVHAVRGHRAREAAPRRVDGAGATTCAPCSAPTDANLNARHDDHPADRADERARAAALPPGGRPPSPSRSSSGSCWP